MRRMPRIGWLAMLLIVALAGIGGGWTLWSSNLIINSSVQTGRVHAGFVNAFTDDDDVLNDAARDSGDTDQCTDFGGVDVDGDGLTSCDPAAPGPDPKPRYDKDVARCDASVDPNNSSVAHVVKRNVYPSYYCTAWFDVQNDGSIPVKVAAVALLDMSHDPDSGLVIPAPGAVAPLRPSTVYDVDLDGDTQPDINLHVGGIEECQQVDPGQSLQLSVDQHVKQTAPQDAVLTYSLAVAMVQWNECPITDLELLGVLVPGIDVRVVGPGNLVGDVPQIVLEPVDGEDGEREPDEPEDVRGEPPTLRAFNTETLMEYEVTLSAELAGSIHSFREALGLTLATEGVDDPAAIETPGGPVGADLSGVDEEYVSTGLTDGGAGGADLGRSLGWSNGQDSRVPITPCPGGVPPCTWPWRAISQFWYPADPEESRCSGTLIGPRHLYTAAHCINNQGTNNWLQPAVVPARDGASKPYGESALAGPGFRWYVTPAQWRTCDPDGDGVRDGDDVSCVPFDWGLLVIPDRLGSLTGWFGYVARPAGQLNAQFHYNRGYPCIVTCSFANEPAAQQPRRLYGDLNPCSLANYYSLDADGWNRVIHNSCDISGGHSGSAVYHYFFDTNLGKWVPVVSMVEVWENCFTCGPGVDHPNRSPRITPSILNAISWLRQTFP